MKFHTSKLLTIIQYTGDEPKVVRELLTNPLPTVKKDDLLIVPENVGKFLAREGSPFERVDIENFLGNFETNYINQISDDAVATVDKLTQTILELEGQLKIKQDELEGFELRQNDEIEELKKVNQELNEKMELIQNKTLETNPSDISPVDTIPKTTKKATTKASKEETL
jgi:hypothetical protein